MNAVTRNHEQKLYVFRHENGYSCLGYDVALEETQALAKRLKKPELCPDKSDWGTLSVLDKRNTLLDLARQRNLGTWFSPRTSTKVRNILEKSRHTGDVLRLFYGDNVSGRDWLDEYGIYGRIGRSTGILKIPLMLSDGECGGPGICDSAIVRIIRVRDRKELYRHPAYQPHDIRVVDSDLPEYSASAVINGDVVAHFPDHVTAYHWAAFMTGKSLDPLPEHLH